MWCWKLVCVGQGWGGSCFLGADAAGPSAAWHYLAGQVGHSRTFISVNVWTFSIASGKLVIFMAYFVFLYTCTSIWLNGILFYKKKETWFMVVSVLCL